MNSPHNQSRIAAGASTLLEDPAFLEQLAVAAAASDRDLEQARKYARKCLHEIEATPKDSWYAPVAKFARFIYTRSYEPELDINREALAKLQADSKDQLLLFLWSHKSHMDSFVFLLSLYDNGFRPLPLVFAGINMNFLGFGSLARRVGAIFLRRSFHDDPIYKLVFRHYIDYLIRNRIPLTWSIEGTRSRTGRLSPPKLGILNWVLEACEREQMTDVKLVPVSIAFDRIAEIDDYVALQKGMPKRKESLGWFLNFIFGMKEPYGKIYVRYAEPIGLQDAPEVVSEKSRERLSLATRLGFETCNRIEQITPIKSADALAMVLLGANGRALTVPEIAAQAGQIVAVVKARGLPVASGFRIDSEEQVAGAALAMSRSGMATRYARGGTEVYYIPEQQQPAAAYYSNTITHFFLAAAMGELALARCVDDISLPCEASLRAEVERLRDLFKFEFFYPPKETFWQQVMEETGRHYPGWQEGSTSLHKQLRTQPPRFGHAIFRAIVEAYNVMAETLLALDDKPVADEKKLLSTLLDQGQEMLLRHFISSAAGVSKDIYYTGLRLAAHRGLLVGNGLRDRRLTFARETLEVLNAVNELQQAYDEAWFQPRVAREE